MEENALAALDNDAAHLRDHVSASEAASSILENKVAYLEADAMDAHYGRQCEKLILQETKAREQSGLLHIQSITEEARDLQHRLIAEEAISRDLRLRCATEEAQNLGLLGEAAGTEELQWELAAQEGAVAALRIELRCAESVPHKAVSAYEVEAAVANAELSAERQIRAAAQDDNVMIPELRAKVHSAEESKAIAISTAEARKLELREMSEEVAELKTAMTLARKAMDEGVARDVALKNWELETDKWKSKARAWEVDSEASQASLDNLKSSYTGRRGLMEEKLASATLETKREEEEAQHCRHVFKQHEILSQANSTDAPRHAHGGVGLRKSDPDGYDVNMYQTVPGQIVSLRPPTPQTNGPGSQMGGPPKVRTSVANAHEAQIESVESLRNSVAELLEDRETRLRSLMRACPDRCSARSQEVHHLLKTLRAQRMQLEDWRGEEEKLRTFLEQLRSVQDAQIEPRGKSVSPRMDPGTRCLFQPEVRMHR